MSQHVLIGPVSTPFAEQHLSRLKQEGRCLTFDHEGSADIQVSPFDTWEQIAARFPSGWTPDFLLLYLPYSFIPEGIYAAPCCRFGLAPDWKLLWHAYHARAGFLDGLFTDPSGVSTFGRAGVPHAQPGFFSGGSPGIRVRVSPETSRDIDLLVVGNLNPAIHPDRGPWLPRLARIAQAWRVQFHSSGAGPGLRSLLSRARILVRQATADCPDSLLHDAIAAGALVIQNADGPPLPKDWPIEGGCVLHRGDDVESIMLHFLKNEDERRKRVQTSHDRDANLDLFETALIDIVDRIERELPSLVIHRLPHQQVSRLERLQARCAQLPTAGPGTDPELIADLESALADMPGEASLDHALGVAFLRRDSDSEMASIYAEVAAEHFRRALEKEPSNAVSHYNRVETLRIAGRHDQAMREARQCMARLPFEPAEPASWRNSAPGNFDYSFFRMAWERAGWENAGDPLAETRAKARLIRGQLQAYLASRSGELVHHYEAVRACELPPFQTALGSSILSTGHALEAIPYLAKAVESNPFDREASRLLFQALGHEHEQNAQRLFARDWRLLHRAMPQAVPSEPWFEECAPPPNELVSIIILCCNQLEVTKLCVESILANTRPNFELVFVDNGSNDGTAEYLECVRTHPVPDRVEIITNAANRGYPAGCNQGLSAARGRFLVFLNNDTVLPSLWLDGLVHLMLAGWPHVGLVGPVTNYAPEPQGIAAGYSDLDGLEPFARHRRQEFAGKFLEGPRVTGFCMLTRREVLDRIGTMDERFGLGFFDDDDLCLRIRQANFKLQIALDTYIHHFGSKTFQGLGVNTQKHLRDNLSLFRDKWGETHTAGYRLVELTSFAVAPHASNGAAPLSAPPLLNSPSASIEVRTRPRKSLSMIVKNEEKNLPDCLRSIRGLFDEVVINDTGSTDRTCEVIREFGAKMVEVPWSNSFAAARNASLDAVTGEWVMWLDADDRLDAENYKRVKELFDKLGDEIAVYAVKVRSGLDMERQAFRLLDQVRIFPKRPGVAWDYRVHEQILPSVARLGGRVHWTGIIVDHTGYQDPSLRLGKLERNLKLLEIDLTERPDDNFTLFNLGWTVLDLGRVDDALKHLHASLDRATNDLSITRKLYDLLATAYAARGKRNEAIDWCDRGVKLYPDDPELLWRRAHLLREDQKLAEACRSLETLFASKPREYFGSVDADLRGYRTRHFLGELYRDQNRLSEAEVQWRASVRERPTFVPSWIALGELYLRQNRWPDVEDVASSIEKAEPQMPNGQIMRAKGLLARNDLSQARNQLEETIQRFPNQILPKVLLTHVLIRDGRDMSAAKRALQDVLAIDPEHSEAKNNLRVLLERHPELGRL